MTEEMKTRPTRGMGDRCSPESCLMKKPDRAPRGAPISYSGSRTTCNRTQVSAMMHLRLSLINEINISNKLFIFLGIQ